MAALFRKVYVEIGNVCNLQCSFCPEVDRAKLRVEKEKFRSLLMEVKPFAERVCFHLMGEPLAHPEFAALVQVAAEVGTPVEITTNGTLLSPAHQEALLNPIIHQVNFSLQSFYDNFRGVDPSTYLEKIFAFTQRAFEERPDLYVNYRLWNLSEEAQSDTVNEDLLARIEKTFSVEINRRLDPRLRKSKNLTGRLYLHYDTRFEWPDPSSPLRREKGSCQGTRTHVGIHADGTVVPCCLDKEARIPLGNTSEMSFAQVIAGPRFQNMREGFERGELRESLCQRCTFATRFG